MARGKNVVGFTRNATLELSVSQQYVQLANVELTAEREGRKEPVALRYLEGCKMVEIGVV